MSPLAPFPGLNLPTFTSRDIYPQTLAVRVGSQFREEGGEAFAVDDYEQHPDYNVYWGNSDVLLLYLRDEVPFRDAVRPVQLPAPSAGTAAGEQLLLTGYGDFYVSRAAVAVRQCGRGAHAQSMSIGYPREC